jgi:hypothetical protein
MVRKLDAGWVLINDLVQSLLKYRADHTVTMGPKIKGALTCILYPEWVDLSGQIDDTGRRPESCSGIVSFLQDLNDQLPCTGPDFIGFIDQFFRTKFKDILMLFWQVLSNGRSSGAIPRCSAR